MVMLTNLADIARTSGLTVIEQAGWKTRGHGQMSGVRGVVLHHTAGAASGNYPSLGVVQNGRAGLAGPLAQIGLARDGSVLIIAAGLAWHAGAGSGYGLPKNGANAWMIAIEAESTGRGDWTSAQLDAYPRLVAALARGYGFPVGMAIAHKEWAPGRKSDPAGWPGDMAGFRASVQTLLNGGTLPSGGPGYSAPTPAPQPKNADGSLRIAVDGIRGPGTIGRWQEVMGTPIDGKISRPSTLIKADQAYLNREMAPHLNALGTGVLAVDGIEGPKTIRVRQFLLFNRFGPQVLGRGINLGKDVDGIAGVETTKLHQFALNQATRGSGRY